MTQPSSLQFYFYILWCAFRRKISFCEVTYKQTVFNQPFCTCPCFTETSDTLRLQYTSSCFPLSAVHIHEALELISDILPQIVHPQFGKYSTAWGQWLSSKKTFVQYFLRRCLLRRPVHLHRESVTKSLSRLPRIPASPWRFRHFTERTRVPGWSETETTLFIPLFVPANLPSM